MSRHVEGRLAFSIRLPSYSTETVASDITRLVEAVNRAGFDVRALDVSTVTKGSDDSTAGQQS